MQRARLGGVGSPKGNRWRNADARPNAPAPRISPSPKASPKVWPDRRSPPKAVARGLRTSGGATHNSADFGDYSRTRPSARDSGIGEAFVRR